MYFLETYSRMTDDELAYLLATRSDTLVDEARLALSSILETRDSARLRVEVEATLEDLKGQANALDRHGQEQIAKLRLLRKGFHLSCLAFSSVGLLLLIIGDNERGAILSASGFIGSVLFEANRLIVRFVAATFTMN